MIVTTFSAANENHGHDNCGHVLHYQQEWQPQYTSLPQLLRFMAAVFTFSADNKNEASANLEDRAATLLGN